MQGWNAEILCTEKSLKIKYLHDDDNAVTGIQAHEAARRPIVEFSARAGIGFARG